MTTTILRDALTKIAALNPENFDHNAGAVFMARAALATADADQAPDATFADDFAYVWSLALSDAAMYVEGHCANGAHHAKAITNMPMPRITARPAPVGAVPNFCETCGKRTPPGSIHTCTPPEAVGAVQAPAAGDILNAAQSRMWTALDRQACPGYFMQIASDAILNFKVDSYGGALPAAAPAAPIVAPPSFDAIAQILVGIDAMQTESKEGWWETSTGADFGSTKLAAIKALFGPGAEHAKPDPVDMGNHISNLPPARWKAGDFEAWATVYTEGEVRNILASNSVERQDSQNVEDKGEQTDIERAFTDISDLIAFAFDKGHHELGYDPVAVLRGEVGAVDGEASRARDAELVAWANGPQKTPRTLRRKRAASANQKGE